MSEDLGKYACGGCGSEVRANDLKCPKCGLDKTVDIETLLFVREVIEESREEEKQQRREEEKQQSIIGWVREKNRMARLIGLDPQRDYSWLEIRERQEERQKVLQDAIKGPLVILKGLTLVLLIASLIVGAFFVSIWVYEKVTDDEDCWSKRQAISAEIETVGAMDDKTLFAVYGGEWLNLDFWIEERRRDITRDLHLQMPTCD